MNAVQQAVHVFKKDLRRYWPLVALFFGVLSVDAAVGSKDPVFITGVIGRVAGGLGFRGILFSLIAILTAALVVHEDDVSQGGAFWASRPISAVGLLLGKLMFVGAFLFAMPLAFQAYAILVAAPAEGAVYHMAQSAVYQGAMLALVMVAAALTKDLKGVVFLGIGGYLLLTIASSLVAPDGMGRIIGMRFRTGYLQERIWWLVAGGGLVALQFFTRRTRWVMASAAAAVLISAQVSMMMAPLPSVPTAIVTSSGLPGLRHVLPDERRPRVEVADVVYSPGINSTRDGGLAGIDVVVRTAENGLSYMPRLNSIRVTLHEDDGSREVESPARPYAPVQRYVPYLEGYRWFGRGDQWAQFDVRVLSSPHDQIATELAGVDRVEISSEFDAYEPLIIGYLPLSEGAAMDWGRRRISVSHVYTTAEQVQVGVSMTEVGSEFANLALGRSPRVDIILVNHVRKEYLVATTGGSTGLPRRLVVSGPMIMSDNYNATYKLGATSPNVEALDPSWFDDAEIMVYTRRYAGTFVGRTYAEIGDLELATQPISLARTSQDN